VSQAALPPQLRPSPPAAGSPRYFALLYTPATLRPVFGTLLALADEISAGGARGLDHSVAHVRLEWWRGEAERYARGEPQHPWLRALLAQHPASRGLDLQPLVQAAALDLATGTQSAQPGVALPAANMQRAVFELAARVLGIERHTDPLSPQRLERGSRRCRRARFRRAGFRPAAGRETLQLEHALTQIAQRRLQLR